MQRLPNSVLRSASALLALTLAAAPLPSAEAQASARLIVTPSMVPPGGTVTATWTGTAAPTSTVTVGLYRPGGRDLLYGDRLVTTGAAAGSVAFGLPNNVAPGTYELRLSGSRSSDFLAVSNSFTVAAGITSVIATPVLRAPGTPVSATWSRISAPTAADWVGLFRPGAPDSDVLIRQATVGTPAGTVLVDLPPTLAPGTYELRLFSGGGTTRLAFSNQFTVQAGTPSLVASATEVPPGATLTAYWQDTSAPTSTVSVELSFAGEDTVAYGARFFSTGAAHGAVPFVLPSNIAPGTYELRLRNASRNTLLAISNRFTVEARIPSLTATAVSLQPGAIASATWSGVAAPTAADRIGLYHPGDDNASPITERTTYGTVFGTVPFVLPSDLPPGVYELRLFAQGGQTLLARSNRILVAPGTPLLTITPARLAPGGTLTAIWRDTAAPTSQVRLGFYIPGHDTPAYGLSAAAVGAAAGSILFTLPGNIPPGTYELRLLDNRGGLLAWGNRFTVEAGIPGLAASPVRQSRGRAISAAWSRIPAPGAGDWVGLFTPSNKEAPPLFRVNTSGATNGQVSLDLRGDLAPGIYELRLFSGAGNVELARSNAVIVTE